MKYLKTYEGLFTKPKWWSVFKEGNLLIDNLLNSNIEGSEIEKNKKDYIYKNYKLVKSKGIGSLEGGSPTTNFTFYADDKKLNASWKKKKELYYKFRDAYNEFNSTLTKYNL
jgi:hypothetical protein